MLDLPEVEQLARMMLESLRKAQASTRVGRARGNAAVER
jgi:hypothetical protein